MEIALAVATLIGGLAALWYFWDKLLLKRKDSSADLGLVLSADVRAGGATYDVTLRAANSHAPEGLPIITGLFCRVHKVRRHPSTRHVQLAGAPIHSIRLPVLQLQPSPGDRDFQLSGDRCYPSGEVEDFRVKVGLTPGWQYLVSFGARWRDVTSDNEHTVLSEPWFLGESGDGDGDVPPSSREDASSMESPNLDRPLTLTSLEWPERQEETPLNQAAEPGGSAAG